MFAWMSARGRKALHEDERCEPAGQERTDCTAPHPEDCEQAGERRPLREPCAPEELAQVVHLLAPVIEVELDVPVDVDCHDSGGACREPDLLEREHGKLAEPALLPDGEHEQRGHDRGTEDEARSPAPRDEVREDGADAHEEVRWLHSSRCSEQEARHRRVGRRRPASSERTRKRADASTSTIEGKSAIAVSPSAWGRKCSVQRSW